MRPGTSQTTRAGLAAFALVTLATLATTGRGDEPNRLGRLFRFGAAASPALPPTPAAAPAPATTRMPVGPVVESGPADAPSAASAPRLIPQPRVSRAVTEADPIVTRVALGRSDDGRQFGMFLQVYADGTVIDSEGVHRPGRDAIKGVVAALEQGDLYRLKGHCGTPSADFVEHVQIVVYERSMGRLRANVFSFSGNPQGCDRAVVRLQAALDGLQARLTPPAPGQPAPATAAPPPGPMPTAAPIRLDAPVEAPAR